MDLIGISYVVKLLVELLYCVCVCVCVCEDLNTLELHVRRTHSTGGRMKRRARHRAMLM